MSDSRNAAMLRANVFAAILVSIVCGLLSKLLSAGSTKVRIPVKEHVPKAPRAFDRSKRYMIASFTGNEIPSSLYVAQFSQFGFDAILIPFHGVENVTSEWESKLSEFAMLLESKNLKYSFYIQGIPERGAGGLERDMSYLHEHYATSNAYFKLENKPFISFDIKEGTSGIRGALRNISSKEMHYFPCAAVDSRDTILAGYEMGLECFTSYQDTANYVWSTMPTVWGQAQTTCNSHASIFIPAVQNDYKSAEYRRHEEEHMPPEMDYPEETDPVFPSEPSDFHEEDHHPGDPDHPEDEERLQRIREEEERRKREMEERRHRHHSLRSHRPKDLRSNFHYAWDYAVESGTHIIIVHPANTTNWIESDAENFTTTLVNLSKSFLH